MWWIKIFKSRTWSACRWTVVSVGYLFVLLWYYLSGTSLRWVCTNTNRSMAAKYVLQLSLGNVLILLKSHLERGFIYIAADSHTFIQAVLVVGHVVIYHDRRAFVSQTTTAAAAAVICSSSANSEAASSGHRTASLIVRRRCRHARPMLTDCARCQQI